jgi:hypothetical protein
MIIRAVSNGFLARGSFGHRSKLNLGARIRDHSVNIFFISGWHHLYVKTAIGSFGRDGYRRRSNMEEVSSGSKSIKPEDCSVIF